MKKIAFLGAGSVQFTLSVVRDMTTFPALSDWEICLMDINPHRLHRIRECVERILRETGVSMTVTATERREDALQGADAVMCTVFNGDVEIWRHEIEIPKKYGVDINIGDTRSVSGIFRALRNIPLMLEICRDMERICPNAILLNYTNPMSMLCKAMLTETSVDVTGLCHSVQGTARMLAQWADTDPETVEYTCLGINHMAFFTKLENGGKDLYPVIAEKIKLPEFYEKEKVRNEMFQTFGYYVTESSGHNSEYTPWFRKRPDLIEKFCTGTSWNPGEYAKSLKLRSNPNRFDEQVDGWLGRTLDKARGTEYAANILNARIGDGSPFEFNANLLNQGSIPNLPQDACVEIPVVADPKGYHRKAPQPLPSAPAILVNQTAMIENLVYEAYTEKSKQKVIQAVSLDPLCGAVLSLEEIRQMCEEIFAANGDYLAEYR